MQLTVPVTQARRHGRRPTLLLSGLVLVLAAAGVSTACAQTVEVDTGRFLPPGFRVKATVGRNNRRPVITASGPRGTTWSSQRRPAPPPTSTPKVLRPRSSPTPTVNRSVPPDADRTCLAGLASWGVPHVTAGAVKGISTAVEITGPIRGIRLIARGRKTALMDCELARSLAEAAPYMRELGITGLSFSGVYDYRNVRGSSKLSGHAYGLAIDVHALETNLGHLDVERDYPKDPDRWRSAGRSDVSSCLGHPPGAGGRLLRSLACQLRGHNVFRLIITPDDNSDHRNHLHIEAHPHRPSELYSGSRSQRSYQGRHLRHSRR